MPEPVLFDFLKQRMNREQYHRFKVALLEPAGHPEALRKPIGVDSLEIAAEPITRTFQTPAAGSPVSSVLDRLGSDDFYPSIRIDPEPSLADRIVRVQESAVGFCAIMD